MSYEVYALNPPPRRGSGISPYRYSLNPFATPSQAMAAAYKRFGAYKPKSKKAKAIWAKKSKAKKRKPAKNPARKATRPLFGYRPFVPNKGNHLFPARNAPMGSTLGIAPSPRWSKPKAKKARSTNMSLKRNAKGRFLKRSANGKKKPAKKGARKSMSAATKASAAAKRKATMIAKLCGIPKSTPVADYSASGPNYAAGGFNPPRRRKNPLTKSRLAKMRAGKRKAALKRAKRRGRGKIRVSVRRPPSRSIPLGRAQRAMLATLGWRTGKGPVVAKNPRGRVGSGKFLTVSLKRSGAKRGRKVLPKRVRARLQSAGYYANKPKRSRNGRRHAKRHNNPGPGLVVAVKDQTSKLLSMSFGKSVLAVGAGFVAASQLPIMLSKVAKKDLTSGPVGVVTSALSAAVASAVAIQVAPGSANAIMIGGGLEVLFRLVAALAPSQSAMIEGPSVAKVDAAMARVSGGVKDYVMLSGYDGSVSTNMGFPVLTGEDLIRGQAAGPGVRDYVDVGMNDYVGVGGEAEKYGSETF